jgi:hypothetical protein
MQHRSFVVAFCVAVMLPCSATAQELFDFHSAFWMNLHHYLQALSRANEPRVEELPSGATVRERSEWAAAVDFYRTRYGKRSLLFDEQMLTIKQQLIVAESAATIEGVPLTPEHRQVLERAAPVYRKHRWSQHDAANRRFIASLQKLLAQHGRRIADRLAASFNDTWPGAFRVDIVADAGPPGNAYTTNVPNPTHITIGVTYEGVSALEIVFHEASHHWDQQLMKAVNDAAQQTQLRAPPDLWHALLFYNAGRITADALAAGGTKNYELLMVQGKIFARPGWHDAIARHWPAFLAGTATRREVVAEILREIR